MQTSELSESWLVHANGFYNNIEVLSWSFDTNRVFGQTEKTGDLNIAGLELEAKYHKPYVQVRHIHPHNQYRFDIMQNPFNSIIKISVHVPTGKPFKRSRVLNIYDLSASLVSKPPGKGGGTGRSQTSILHPREPVPFHDRKRCERP
jgi:hypothetical protein